jgi:transcriptional regulator GlxA family with amidase domain
MMTRRRALGLFASISAASVLSKSSARGETRKLDPPSKGKIPVAFLLSENANVIDFCGPWSVFESAHVPDRGPTMDDMMPFRLFTVAESRTPVRATGGLTIVPNFDFTSAPDPSVIVVPAQSGRSEALLSWLRRSSEKADVTMSVCTGAFVLGEAGLLEGGEATTHHDFYDDFEKRFPDVPLKRGLRFVEGDRVSTAGGLTSGTDLALRVLERYFGREVARATAECMEYQATGWIV